VRAAQLTIYGEASLTHLAVYLMTYIDEVTGKVVYTLKASAALPLRAAAANGCGTGLTLLRRLVQKMSPSSKPTASAHPARFSPDDKFSKVSAGAARTLLRSLSRLPLVFSLFFGINLGCHKPPDSNRAARPGARHVQEAVQPATDAAGRARLVAPPLRTAAQGQNPTPSAARLGDVTRDGEIFG
jgi:hypothetical protein